MSSMTLYKRPEAEQRITAALEKLYPDGEILGTMLSRYTPWEEIKDIPLMEMGRVCAQLEKEPEFLAFLGENKYFAAVTVGMKIALYQAAIDDMEKALAGIGYQRNDGITFEKFRGAWNMCLKECTFPPLPAEPVPPEKPHIPDKKQKPKRARKISNSDIKTIKEVISFLNKTSGRSFRTTSKVTQQHIMARINEGYVLEDFVKVIAGRCAKWNRVPEYGEKDMRDYLRPETLFGSKFESYLNAERSEPPKDNFFDSTNDYVPMKQRKNSREEETK